METNDNNFAYSLYFRAGNEVIAHRLHGSQMQYPLYNAHSDVVAMAASNGTVVSNYTYTAFGKETSSNSMADTMNPLRYAGEYFDEETGNLYLRARYYDSDLGRFTSEDPAKAGMNWYVYCNNNPVSWVDRTGCDLEGPIPDPKAYEGTALDMLRILITTGATIIAFAATGGNPIPAAAAGAYVGGLYDIALDPTISLTEHLVDTAQNVVYSVIGAALGMEEIYASIYFYNIGTYLDNASSLYGSFIPSICDVAVQADPSYNQISAATAGIIEPEFPGSSLGAAISNAAKGIDISYNQTLAINAGLNPPQTNSKGGAPITTVPAATGNPVYGLYEATGGAAGMAPNNPAPISASKQPAKNTAPAAKTPTPAKAATKNKGKR